MEQDFDTVIKISSDRAEIVVEQTKQGGVISRKNISPETLGACMLSSRFDDTVHETGLLPDNCIGMSITKQFHYYYIRHPEVYTELSYFGTEYTRFPIPRLVFGFKYMPVEGKVVESRVCVVPSERLSKDTKLLIYPFSNVSTGGNICIGNNALPVYKNPARLSGLPGYILRIPNNNDRYSNGNNRMKLEYRDLLELIKDKAPEYYYSDILRESGQTLNDFMNWR